MGILLLFYCYFIVYFIVYFEIIFFFYNILVKWEEL